MPSVKTTATIRFHHLKKAAFAHRALVKTWVARILKDAKRTPAAINYIFCPDEYLRKINKEYLSHDYYTDIVTFDLSEPGDPVTADIYISVDRVRENARNYKSPFTLELLRVIFHGALHLSGYKDKSEDDRRIMREKENHYLAQYKRSVPRDTVS
jgi:probable rRNA maturation factor